MRTRPFCNNYNRSSNNVIQLGMQNVCRRLKVGVYSFSIEMDCYVSLSMIIFALLYLIEIVVVCK